MYDKNNDFRHHDERHLFRCTTKMVILVIMTITEVLPFLVQLILQLALGALIEIPAGLTGYIIDASLGLEDSIANRMPDTHEILAFIAMKG